MVEKEGLWAFKVFPFDPIYALVVAGFQRVEFWAVLSLIISFALGWELFLRTLGPLEGVVMIWTWLGIFQGGEVAAGYAAKAPDFF